MKRFKDFKVGQNVVKGFPGSRVKHHAKVTALTPTIVRAGFDDYDRGTGLQKGVSRKPAYGKVPTLHVATEKQLEQAYREQLLSMIRGTDWEGMPTEKLEQVLDTHTIWSYEHIKKFYKG